MVNWLKVAGIVLVVVGILTTIAGLTYAVISAGSSATVLYSPWWVAPLGIAMIALGAYLYYLGGRKKGA